MKPSWIPSILPGVRTTLLDAIQLVTQGDDVGKRHLEGQPAAVRFYPARQPCGVTVVVCPGGGYQNLAHHEGEVVAHWLNDQGIHAAVLKYRHAGQANTQTTGLSDSSQQATDVDISDGAGWQGPLLDKPALDASLAMLALRYSAKDLDIHPGKIAIMGFSAGGHVAATLCTHWKRLDAGYLKLGQASDKLAYSCRPDASILIYPVISMQRDITHGGSRERLIGSDASSDLAAFYSAELQVNAQTPPAFLFHTFDDKVVPQLNAIRYAEALARCGVPCELHVYNQPGAGHGIGLAQSIPNLCNWPRQCERFLKDLFLDNRVSE